MATEKQINFMKRLAGERLAVNKATGETDTRTVAEVIEEAGAWGHYEGLPVPEMSKVIDRLMAAPKATAKAASNGSGPRYEAKRGDVHVLDGSYVRVHEGQKSGHLYACQATIVAEAEWGEDETGKRICVRPGKAEWDFVRGLLGKLGEETKATPEEAAAFGALVGRCCFCSHPIDTPESTAVGYGPYCAEKYGLPWGDTTQEVEVASPEPEPVRFVKHDETVPASVLVEIVRQSAAIHPEWDVEAHVSYLVNDAFAVDEPTDALRDLVAAAVRKVMEGSR